MSAPCSANVVEAASEPSGTHEPALDDRGLPIVVRGLTLSATYAAYEFCICRHCRSIVLFLPSELRRFTSARQLCGKPYGAGTCVRALLHDENCDDRETWRGR